MIDWSRVRARTLRRLRHFYDGEDVAHDALLLILRDVRSKQLSDVTPLHIARRVGDALRADTSRCIRPGPGGVRGQRGSAPRASSKMHARQFDALAYDVPRSRTVLHGAPWHGLAEDLAAAPRLPRPRLADDEPPAASAEEEEARMRRDHLRFRADAGSIGRAGVEALGRYLEARP